MVATLAVATLMIETLSVATLTVATVAVTFGSGNVQADVGVQSDHCWLARIDEYGQTQPTLWRRVSVSTDRSARIDSACGRAIDVDALIGDRPIIAAFATAVRGKLWRPDVAAAWDERFESPPADVQSRYSLPIDRDEYPIDFLCVVDRQLHAWVGVDANLNRTIERAEIARVDVRDIDLNDVVENVSLGNPWRVAFGYNDRSHAAIASPPRLDSGGSTSTTGRIVATETSKTNPPWVRFYDGDPLAAFIDELEQLGLDETAIRDRLSGFDDGNKDDSTINRLLAAYVKLLLLDQAKVRKSNLDAIVHSADSVLSLCRVELDGLPPPRPLDRDPNAADATKRSPRRIKHVTNPRSDRIYAIAVSAAYRRARAIGYRHLPDVIAIRPIDDDTAHDRTFLRSIESLNGLTDVYDPRFGLLLVRYHRRIGDGATALTMLRRYGRGSPWYYKKRRDIYDDIGWEPARRLGYAWWFTDPARPETRPLVR